MKQTFSSYTLQDQRGVAMLLELVLVAAVLSLVGLAVYQTNHRAATNTAAVPAVHTPAPNSPQGIANAAAATTVQDSATDASISATADAATDQVSQTDNDVSNLGASSNASF